MHDLENHRGRCILVREVSSLNWQRFPTRLSSRVRVRGETRGRFPFHNMAFCARTAKPWPELRRWCARHFILADTGTRTTLIISESLKVSFGRMYVYIYIYTNRDQTLLSALYFPKIRTYMYENERCAWDDLRAVNNTSKMLILETVYGFG